MGNAEAMESEFRKYEAIERIRGFWMVGISATRLFRRFKPRMSWSDFENFSFLKRYPGKTYIIFKTEQRDESNNHG